MAHLFKLRALSSFVDVQKIATDKDGDAPGSVVSVSKGDIIHRGEEVAERLIDAGLVEEILSPIDQMVQTAHDLGDVAFVTDNAEVTAACAEAGVGCVPTGKGKK